MPSTNLRPPKTNFVLRTGHPLAGEIKRILREQADMAIWQLTTPGLDADEAVHEARKCFKRTRGVLRLVRDDIGRQRYARMNARFRDAGRQLSALRTSAVLAETLEAVRQRYPQQLAAADMEQLLARLRAHHRHTHGQRGEQQKRFAEIARLVQGERAQIAALPLPGNSFPARGMRRVYACGRQAMALCRQHPSVTHFHDWRKRVKYHRYHLRLFSSAWPRALTCITAESVTLSELLGLDHDLAELHRALQENPELCPPAQNHAPLRALIESYRQELEARSFDIGQRLYAEKPGAFVKRMARYWRLATDI